MKTSTSMKITKNFKNVYCAGYTDLHYIIPDDFYQFYNAGVYGWNCDIFTDYRTSTVISTGYRNTRGKLIPFEIIEKYTQLGKANRENSATWEDYQKGQWSIIEAFIDEILEG